MNKVVLVNGYPATGKTTLAKRLSRDLGVPTISKDGIKEYLADSLGVNSDSWSLTLRHAADAALVGLVGARSGEQALIVENAFIRESFHADLSAVLGHSGATALELYCRTERTERLKRSNDRLDFRHPIHRDRQTIHDMTEEELEAKYEPLRLGELVVVNTTAFSDEQYNSVLDHVRGFLERD